MKEIEFKSDVTVELIDMMGSEQVRDVLAEHFPTVLEAWEERGE